MVGSLFYWHIKVTINSQVIIDYKIKTNKYCKILDKNNIYKIMLANIIEEISWLNNSSI